MGYCISIIVVLIHVNLLKLFQSKKCRNSVYTLWLAWQLFQLLFTFRLSFEWLWRGAQALRRCGTSASNLYIACGMCQNHMIDCRNVNNRWKTHLGNKRFATKVGHYLLSSYFLMLSRFTRYYTLIIRLWSISLCTYLFLIYTPVMLIKTQYFHERFHRIVPHLKF